MARRRSPAGFTLIETMIVVAILGIAASVAGPRIVHAIQKQRAIAAEKEVHNSVMRARNYARMTLCEISVSVDTSGPRHRLTWGPATTDTSDPCFSRPTYQQVFREEIRLSSFTADGATQEPFKFNSSGGTDYTSRGRLQVTNTMGGGRLIEVWPLIGTVRVVE